MVGHTPHNTHTHTHTHTYIYITPLTYHLLIYTYKHWVFAIYLKSVSTLLLIGKLRWLHKNCLPGLKGPLSLRPGAARGVQTLDLDFETITAKSVSKLAELSSLNFSLVSAFIHFLTEQFFQFMVSAQVIWKGVICLFLHFDSCANAFVISKKGSLNQLLLRRRIYTVSLADFDLSIMEMRKC